MSRSTKDVNATRGPPRPTQSELERSLRAYGLFLPLSCVYPWIPVFFLFLSERFPLDRVLLLGSIYYFSVVLLEVPSGYLSDRVGRRLTLQVAMLAMASAYLLFLLGGQSFPIFVAAEILLAVGFASLSGTATSYHYDTLAGLSRSHEYGDREARRARDGHLLAMTGAALGGALALLDLRLAYALSGLIALAGFLATLAMHEPPREAGHESVGLLRQLQLCVGFLRRPLLAWVFGYVVLLTTLEHVPYQFYQPYIAAVLGEAIDRTEWTPLATGLMTAVFALFAALAASQSMRLQQRLGLGGTLILVTAFQTVLIATMGWGVHAAVLLPLTLRSCQSAISHVLVNAAVAPRVPQAQRATYLSLHSLAGRLGYSGVLLVLSRVAAEASGLDFDTIGVMLRGCTWIAVAGLAALLVTRPMLRQDG